MPRCTFCVICGCQAWHGRVVQAQGGCLSPALTAGLPGTPCPRSALSALLDGQSARLWAASIGISRPWERSLYGLVDLSGGPGRAVISGKMAPLKKAHQQRGGAGDQFSPVHREHQVGAQEGCGEGMEVGEPERTWWWGGVGQSE